jgi:hypothetical protein
VTVLAWAIIVLSGLAIPISVVSSLMVAAHSHGTSSVGPLGWLIVVAGPPASLVGGIGLLRRKRWAYFYVLAILGTVLLVNSYRVIRSPFGSSKQTVVNGVLTTTVTMGGIYYLPLVATCAALLVKLLSRSVRTEFGIQQIAILSPPPPVGTAMPAGSTGIQPATTGRIAGSQSPPESEANWRVGHQGRDSMYYEEFRNGAWQRLEIDGEMLMGRAHHAVYFASPQRWLGYPEWARHRRDEIIARIKTQFREPDYDYGTEAVQTGAPLSGTPAPPLLQPASGVILSGPRVPVSRPGASVTHQPVGRSTSPAVWLVLVVLFGLSGFMFWLVKAGLGKGETFFPSKLASQRRSVSRAADPVMFWTSISLYAAVGIGSAGLGIWGIKVGSARSPGHRGARARSSEREPVR